jgi:AraC-like DNA-binding protein
MASHALVRSTVLIDFPAIALEAGIDPNAALREARIDAASLSRPDVTIPAERVAWLLDRVAGKHGLHDLGVRIAMRRRLASLGIAGLVLGQQPTVRHALTMAEKYRHLLNDAVSVHLEEEGDTATLTLDMSLAASVPSRQARELGLSAYVHLFRLLLTEKWSPQSVHFMHAAPKGATLHRRFFGCRVQFGSAFDGFECRRSDLDRVNGDTDSMMAAYAGALLDSSPVWQPGATTAMVNRLIRALLPMGKASIRNVAHAMGRHVRALQRELEVEGSEFKDLLGNARAELALALLKVPARTIDEISQTLGYSTPSAFIRFFRARFNTSPGEWRTSSRAV